MLFRLATGLLVFVATSTLLAFALALSEGRLTPGLAQVGLWLGLAAGWVAAAQTRDDAPRRRLTGWEWAAYVGFALFALRSFCWLLFYDKDVLKVGAPNNLGDICRHLLYARMFADGEPLWPEHPLHAWALLRYYPGADFFQALWLSLGFDDLRLLAWSGLAGSLLAAFFLRRWGGAFTLGAFLCAGGLAGFQFIASGVLKDYQMELAWKPLATAIFVTQRGFLFALPAGLLLLLSWRARWFPIAVRADLPAVPPPEDWTRRWLEKEPPREPEAELVPPPPVECADRVTLPLWVEWLLLAGLAFFQLYAFLFFMALLAAWLLAWQALPPSRVEGRTAWGTEPFWLFALAMAGISPLVLLMTNFGGGASFIHWAPGWLLKDGENPFGFWLLNFGLSLPLAAALWCWLVHRRWLRPEGAPDAAEAFVLPAGVAFAICCLVSFAPWPWDNTKLMIWAYLATAPFVYSVILTRLPPGPRTPLIVALFLSGAVSLAGGLRDGQRGFELGKRSELEEVRAVVKDLPRSVRFACSPDYNHPLVLLGRRIAMGYDGHLYGYGLEYKELRVEVQRVMFGAKGWRNAARRLDVRYVFWGTREKKRYAKSVTPWAQPEAVVASGEWGTVYDLSKVP
ncbi:MAG: hypothetical protein JSR82_10010 [Verrucomicrobia bacterium]|nr:hypothetical protein [Verrucomicrobiota bacterium]